MTIDTPRDARNGQSEHDILTRHGIPLEFGDTTFRVKPRNMRQEREWLALVQERLVARITAFDSLDSIPAIIASLGEATPDMLELVLVFDTTDQLPSREWLDENAYSKQVTIAFTTLLEETYAPFAVSRRLLPGDRSATIIGSLISWGIEAMTRSPLPEATSSPSPSGGSAAPKKSKKLSPVASSGS